MYNEEDHVVRLSRVLTVYSEEDHVVRLSGVLTVYTMRKTMWSDCEGS